MSVFDLQEGFKLAWAWNEKCCSGWILITATVFPEGKGHVEKALDSNVFQVAQLLCILLQQKLHQGKREEKLKENIFTKESKVCLQNWWRGLETKEE